MYLLKCSVCQEDLLVRWLRASRPTNHFAKVAWKARAIAVTCPGSGANLEHKRLLLSDKNALCQL